MIDKYGKYFKDVSNLARIDVYRVLDLFGVDDHALGHAAKKILLCGVRTGGKTEKQEITEARDTLTRWLEMLEEDEKFVPVDFSGELVDFSEKSEYTLEDIVKDHKLRSSSRYVFVMPAGCAYESACRPRQGVGEWAFSFKSLVEKTIIFITKVQPPLDFTKCIWEVNKK